MSSDPVQAPGQNLTMFTPATATDPPRPGRRFQYSLRAMLVFTTIVAAYFSMGTSIGYVEASGTLISLMLIVVAWRWHRAGAWLFVRGAIAVAAAGILWMVAVDWSWFVEGCEDCWLSRDILQVRVYRMPIYETISEYGALYRIANDLGVPCLHEHSRRWHKYRYWGLIYPCSALH